MLANRESEAVTRLTSSSNGEEIQAMLREALGDLADEVEIVRAADDRPTESPVDTPLWDSLRRVTSKLAPGTENVPFMTVGATDARFFRRQGSVAYGFGLFSGRLTFDDFSTMFHGDNERVDQDSLRLSTELWEATARDLLHG